jgi:hypothetical protein
VPLSRSTKLAALAAAITTLAAAAPASAMVAPPTLRTFDDVAVGTNVNQVYLGKNIVFRDGNACGRIVATGGRSGMGAQMLGGACPPVQIIFGAAQATVAVFAKAGPGTGPTTTTVTAFDANNHKIAEKAITAGEGVWSAFRTSAKPGGFAIRRLQIASARPTVLVDGLSYAPTEQPDTEITDGPSGTVATGDGTFTFVGNQSTASNSRCILDGVVSACRDSFAFTGLAPGDHTFSVGMTDRWGTRDASPATRTWTVAAPAATLGAPAKLAQPFVTG